MQKKESLINKSGWSIYNIHSCRIIARKKLQHFNPLLLHQIHLDHSLKQTTCNNN